MTDFNYQLPREWRIDLAMAVEQTIVSNGAPEGRVRAEIIYWTTESALIEPGYEPEAAHHLAEQHGGVPRQRLEEIYRDHQMGDRA